MELSILINKFNIKGRLVALRPFGNGNINDTYLAIYRNTFTETQVILQRVNRRVFPRPEVIMSNMHEITRHCIRNVVLARDRNGNTKPSKQWAEKKIDGIIVILESLGVYLQSPHFQGLY